MPVGARPRLSIRVVVAGVAAMVMATFWLVAAAIIEHAYGRLADDARTSLAETARLVALAHSQWVDETRALAAALGAILPTTGFEPGRCRSLLASTLANSQGYAAFAAVSPEGLALCGSGEHVPGTDFRDRAYVRRALETGAFTVGEYVVGRVSNQTVLPTASAVLTPFGDVAFVLIISKRLDWFQAVANRLHLPRDTRVSLVDRGGAMLASIPHEAAPSGQAFGVPEILAARGKSNSGTLILGNQVHAYVPLGDGALSAISVVVSRPRSALLGAIEDFRVHANLVVLGVMVLTVLLLVQTMRRLVLRPLHRLADGMRVVHGGDLSWRARTDQAATVEMRRLYCDFNEMVGEVSRIHNRIRAQAETLEQSNRDLQHFAYMVSHDLREPLRSVSGFAQLLARRYASVVDAEGREFVRFITDGTERMSRMLDGVLAYSHIDTQGVVQSPVALDEPLDLALNDLHAAIAEAGATIERPERLPTVRADADQMARLFLNLLSNAIKFRRPGTAPVVRVSACRLDGAWEIAVADNGIGIDQEGRERIFLLFHRQARRDLYDGDGIGLAMAKRIVDRHGGTIRAESIPGQGATILFTLPVAEGEAFSAPS